ncbi:MAG TPA: M23 family metallopeptidase [Terriglobia bacterium]|nr:M23 family metallopeptidase [Terriglobia bacterium]
MRTAALGYNRRMFNHCDRRSRGALTSTGIAVGLVLLILIGALVLTYRRWEGTPPIVTFDHEFKYLGRQPALTMTAEDTGTGLKHVQIILKHQDEETILADDSFDRGGAPASKTYDVGKLLAEKVQFKEGTGTLVIRASDHALRNLFRGNSTEIANDFTVDVTPPRLEVMSGQHYINQGGSECVVYRVSEDAVVSGVQAGPHFFPGFPINASDPANRFALFALAYDLPADTPIKVIARDAAGNSVEASFWQKIFPRKFRSRDISIDDQFLQRVVPEVVSHTPSVHDEPELIQTFVKINSDLRKENHATIAMMSKESEPRFLWDGPFLQLSNSQVESYFADRRTYIYKGQTVDQQDHVGFDLSVVERYPIEATNDGKVILADYFGIYGNTVIIDHGAGLLSLYGHLSSIDVKPGQTVKKKEILGRSGATGLAGGDHLHFGMFLQGVPVNPTEWWDKKWINEHVLDRINPPAPKTARK